METGLGFVQHRHVVGLRSVYEFLILLQQEILVASNFVSNVHVNGAFGIPLVVSRQQ